MISLAGAFVLGARVASQKNKASLSRGEKAVCASIIVFALLVTIAARSCSGPVTETVKQDPVPEPVLVKGKYDISLGQ